MKESLTNEDEVEESGEAMRRPRQHLLQIRIDSEFRLAT